MFNKNAIGRNKERNIPILRKGEIINKDRMINRNNPYKKSGKISL